MNVCDSLSRHLSIVADDANLTFEWNASYRDFNVAWHAQVSFDVALSLVRYGTLSHDVTKSRYFHVVSLVLFQSLLARWGFPSENNRVDRTGKRFSADQYSVAVFV